MNYETVEIEMSDDDKCLYIELYINKHLDGASANLFNEKAEEIGLDLDKIKTLAGECIINAAVVEAVQLAVDAELAEAEAEEQENAGC